MAPSQKREGENFAVKHAVSHYEGLGWHVNHVSRLGGEHKGYDLFLDRGAERRTVEVKGCTDMYGIPDLYGNEIDKTTNQLIADEICIVYHRPQAVKPPIAIIPRGSIPSEFIVPKPGYRISSRFKKAHYMDQFFVHQEQRTNE